MSDTPHSELTTPPSELPAWGRLLLLTQLAKHHPLLGVQYYGSPDVLHAPNGDRWTARREEVAKPDGSFGHVVVIARSPDAFGYDEARAQTLNLEGQLASALRARGAAERGGAPKEGLKSARTRVAEIQAAIAELRPRLVAPETTEWRFDADGLD